VSELDDIPFPAVDAPLEWDSETRVPGSYEAVHRGERVLLLRDQHPLDRKLAEDLAPQARDLEIIRALWRCRFLLTSQIAREWWLGRSLYAAQRRLLRMTAAGWVTRFRPRLSKGKHEWIYQLDRKGFELGKRYWRLDGPYIGEEAKWRPRHVTDYSVVEHDLQVNAWVIAYRQLCGDHLIDWRGPDHGRIEVPTKYEERRFRPVGPEDASRELSGYRRVRDLRLRRFAPVVPDATLTLLSRRSGSEVDVMVELDRTRRPTTNLDKLRRFDAFFTAWWRLADRYRGAGGCPMVVFVCPGEDEAMSLMRAADGEVTGRHAIPGDRPETWPVPGRERMLFAAELDVHEGSTRAWMLPRLPPAERESSDFWAVDVNLPTGS
jgi:hypothetical protein